MNFGREKNLNHPGNAPADLFCVSCPGKLRTSGEGRRARGYAGPCLGLASPDGRDGDVTRRHEPCEVTARGLPGHVTVVSRGPGAGPASRQQRRPRAIKLGRGLGARPLTACDLRVCCCWVASGRELRERASRREHPARLVGRIRLLGDRR